MTDMLFVKKDTEPIQKKEVTEEGDGTEIIKKMIKHDRE